MITQFIDTLYEPVDNNIIALSRALKLKISKTTIRNTFLQELKGTHNIKIKDLQHVLHLLGINVFPAHVAKNELHEFFAPYFIMPGNEEDYFTVLLDIKDNVASIYDPYSGMMEWNYQENGNEPFLVLMIESFEDALEDKMYEANIEQETRDRDRFRKQVIVIDNFISEDECDKIIAFGERSSELRRSEIDTIQKDGTVYSGYSSTRSSSSLNISNYPGLESIVEKVAGIMQLPVVNMEPAQFVKYEKGQQFKLHHDSFTGDERIKTAILYLNDGFDGGETNFPELELSIRPQKGTCLIFPDLDDEQAIIKESLHSSLPIKSGTKYILTTFGCKGAFIQRDISKFVPHYIKA